MSGIPWWSSGCDSALSQLRARPGSFMVGELRSHKPSSEAKKTDVILFCYAVNHVYDVAKRVEMETSLENSNMKVTVLN